MAKKVIYMLDRFNDRLIWAVKYFLCAVLTLQVCLIFVSVVMRYFLNRPLSWSDEMATFMLVYVTFLGTYVASNTGHLAKVELFISLFKGPLHTAAKILSRIFSAGLVGWIGFSAYTKIEAKEASTVTETVMDTSAIDNYVSGLSSDAE